MESNNELESKLINDVVNREENEKGEYSIEEKENQKIKERNTVKINQINQNTVENKIELKKYDELKIELNNQEINKFDQHNSDIQNNIEEKKEDKSTDEKENKIDEKKSSLEEYASSNINNSFNRQENKKFEIRSQDSKSQIKNKSICDPGINEKIEANTGFAGEGLIDIRLSCWHCYKIFDSKKGLKASNSNCTYCSEECLQKYFVLNSVSCIKCSKKILKSESEIGKGEYYCSQNCLIGTQNQNHYI